MSLYATPLAFAPKRRHFASPALPAEPNVHGLSGFPAVLSGGPSAGKVASVTGEMFGREALGVRHSLGPGGLCTAFCLGRQQRKPGEIVLGDWLN